MLSHVIALLSRDAPAFCHYSPPEPGLADAEGMPLATLRGLLQWAASGRLAVNLLYGKTPPSAAHDGLATTAGVTRIVPLDLIERYPDAVVVAHSGDGASLPRLSPSGSRVVNLHLCHRDVSQLPALGETLLTRCRRLNVMLERPDLASEDTLSAYRSALGALGAVVRRWYLSGRAWEVNVLSDRLTLDRPNHCGAGQEHLTLGTDGRFYLCPAAFLDSTCDYVAGALPEGPRFRNQQLLAREQAPICRRCDAFQCKRCVYLNQVSTLEINTPSRGQCVTAHVEREASRQLRQELVLADEAFRRLREVPALETFDPFERVAYRRKTGFRVMLGGGAASDRERPLEAWSDGELAARLQQLTAELERRQGTLHD